MGTDSTTERFTHRILSAAVLCGALLAGGCTGSGSPAKATADADQPVQSTPQPGQTTATPGSGGQGTTTVPTLSLRTSAPTVDQGGNVTLSWTATDAASCTAGGGWSGTFATSGSLNIGPLAVGTTFSLSCDGPGGSVLEMISVAVVGPVALSWVAPEENVDGSALVNLAGYRIYYGDGSRSYSDMVELSEPAATSHILNLASGDYYVAMTALDAQGNESGYSNEVIKTVL